MPKLKSGVIAALGLAMAASLAATGCANADPLGEGDQDSAAPADQKTLVVGSQDYYSSEILAELYAQVLENDDYTVDRQFRIGQRDIYLPEIESGSIDVFPEYTGPLLQKWADEPAERTSEEVHAALVKAAPEGLTVLDAAPATDQDSYVVTREFAEENNLKAISDLAGLDMPLTMGANSEAETLPNGPTGLKETYGIDVEFTPIEDGGGPLTVRALQDGDVQLAIVYTGDPSIAKNDLVVLEDPEGLFLSSNIVPVVSDKVDADATEVINGLSALITSEVLLELNGRSVDEQAPAATIAGDWLREQGLIE